MKIGVIGSGVVAQTLAAGFLKFGHGVAIGTRDPAKLADWGEQHPKAAIESFAGAAAFGELIVLAVKGTVAESALSQCGVNNLSGKVVVDACNPIAEEAPVDGVLKFFTGPNDSLMERLQKAYPAARLVKAFSCVGSAFMIEPKFKDGKPTMFICGDDPAAKKTVQGILDQFGWETADVGRAISARAIEPLCILWCLPGMLRNEWGHAFKLLTQPV